MAVVEAQRSNRDQWRQVFVISVGTVVGTIMVGVVGPIIAAILVGEIWGHH